MKFFRFLTMLLLGIMLNVNLTSCSKDEIIPDTEQGDNNDGSEDVHPNGIPSNIPNNFIYYITIDDIIIRFKNEDVFGGAKIVSNTYSSTNGYGTIEFASEVTAIESNAFSGKKTFTYITIPTSVTSIGERAFYDCSGLRSVTIPGNVRSIDDEAFSGCSGLTSITIPNSLTSIDGWTFADCTGLTTVTIGSGVEKIYKYAFGNCSNLLNVYCHAEDVPVTSSYAFSSSPIQNATLHVPAASIDSYTATEPWSGFGRIVALTE